MLSEHEQCCLGNGLQGNGGGKVIYAAFFFSFSLSVLPSVPHTTLKETAPLWPHLPKQRGGKEAEQISEFLQKGSACLSISMHLIRDNNPLFHFKFNNCTSSLKAC